MEHVDHDDVAELARLERQVPGVHDPVDPLTGRDHVGGDDVWVGLLEVATAGPDLDCRLEYDQS